MVQIVSLALVIIISTILGLLSYYNNPKSATHRLMGVFSATIVFWAFSMYLTLHPPNENVTLFLIRVSMLAAIAMSTAVLMLSHTIPSSRFRMSKRTTIFLLSLAIVGMLTALSPYMFTHLQINENNIEPVSGPGMIMFMITGLGYSISGIFILFKKFRKEKGLIRKQLLYTLAGISIMHILLISANFIAVLLFKTSYFISFGPLFTLPFLISVFYAITRHRLLEIRLLALKAVTFAIVIAVVATAYVSLFLAITNFIPQSSLHPINIALTVLLALNFERVKKSIENATAHIFFKAGYNPNEFLDELGDIITSTLSLNVITNKVLQKITSTLGLTKAAFALIEGDSIKIVETGYDAFSQISKSDIRTLAQKANSKPLALEDISANNLKMLFTKYEISTLIPLESSSAIHGVLILGLKKSGDVFSNQDIQTLDIFTPQIAVAIQNALAYEKIKKFNFTLKAEVEQATKKLKIANKNLRHLDKIKDEFVYVATHELKNPVTAMRGYLSMIDEGSFGKVPKNLEDPINQLNQSNLQLVNLVNDLLQIARAEAHTLRINVQPTNICTIIETVMESVQPLAKQKNLTLNYLCSKDKIIAMADPERLKEVFNNLLSNAIKYSEKGVITISYAEEDNQVITHVKDQGVGIPQEDQPKLFSRFFRVEKEVAKGIPGSGLGLFIVRQLVEKMGGKIWFSSTPGKGSTFSFSLPTKIPA